MAEDMAGGDDAPPTTSKRSADTAAVGAAMGDAGATVVAKTVTINRPVAEVYAFYRDLTNAPLYMDDVERVDMLDDRRAHWVARASGDKSVEWDAEITEDEPERVLAWHSLDEGRTNAGRTTFQDVPGRGTVVGMTLAFDPPGGILGRAIGFLRQRDPSIQARRNLRRLKQLLETGEIATGARNRDLDAKGRTHE